MKRRGWSWLMKSPDGQRVNEAVLVLRLKHVGGQRSTQFQLRGVGEQVELPPRSDILLRPRLRLLEQEDEVAMDACVPRGRWRSVICRGGEEFVRRKDVKEGEEGGQSFRGRKGQ